jgi:hypothetical protein
MLNILQNDRPIIFVCHSLGGLVCEDVSHFSISKKGSDEERLCRQHNSGRRDTLSKSSSVLEGSYSSALRIMALALHIGLRA